MTCLGFRHVLHVAVDTYNAQFISYLYSQRCLYNRFIEGSASLASYLYVNLNRKTQRTKCNLWNTREVWNLFFDTFSVIRDKVVLYVSNHCSKKRGLIPKREVAGSSLRRVHISGLVWSLYKCAAWWRAVYGASATERPLETIREEKRISSSSGVSISS